mmetsp:Transcript_58872/g.70831  ORF Transcript_58872/g.70831 Transcript_58872/m.70831 type:complete len:114 (+) Transcript_58872:2556-2897(+)
MGRSTRGWHYLYNSPKDWRKRISCSLLLDQPFTSKSMAEEVFPAWNIPVLRGESVDYENMQQLDFLNVQGSCHLSTLKKHWHICSTVVHFMLVIYNLGEKLSLHIRRGNSVSV